MNIVHIMHKMTNFWAYIKIQIPGKTKVSIGGISLVSV